VLQDSRFYLLLLKFDEDLAAQTQQAGCQVCGGRLDSARYPRKPRGALAPVPDDYDLRLSFCCANLGCRKRHTPASTRYLGRRVYLGAVVVLAMAMQQGPTPWRASALRDLFGVSLQTLTRWRAWWREAFAESTFWKTAKAAFSSPMDVAGAPRSLLERFCGDAAQRLQLLLRFLQPLSRPTEYVADRR
jgi:hypothetical protein